VHGEILQKLHRRWTPDRGEKKKKKTTIVKLEKQCLLRNTLFAWF